MRIHHRNFIATEQALLGSMGMRHQNLIATEQPLQGSMGIRHQRLIATEQALLGSMGIRHQNIIATEQPLQSHYKFSQMIRYTMKRMGTLVHNIPMGLVLYLLSDQQHTIQYPHQKNIEGKRKYL
jgi:hypothetical protein